MTLDRAWSLYRALTKPTPPLVKRALGLLSDVDQGARLVNEILPDAKGASPTEPGAAR